MPTSSEAERTTGRADHNGALAGQNRLADPAYRVTLDSTFDAGLAGELWAVSANGTIFNHPAWWCSAIAAFGTGRPLFVAKVTSNGKPVGLWPFWRKRLGLREGFCRVIEPVGARVTDYCQPLIRRDHDSAGIEQLMIERLAGLLDAQTILLLPKNRVAYGAASVISTAASRLGLLVETQQHPCPSMKLPGSYEALEQRWSKSHRGDVRRQMRKLAEAGRLEFVTASTRAAALSMLPRLFAMHAANWRARSGFSDLSAGPVPEFLRLLASDLPLDCIDASELHLDGVAIALHFGFRSSRSLLWYKPTFDIAWANYAPGKVHVALAARHGIETGLDTMDFMQGEEPYKQQWSDLTTLTTTFALARPSAYPMWAWNTRVRHFAAEYRN